MMNRAAAEAYGRTIGVRFYLMNDHGGLYGGYQTKKAAEDAKRIREAEDRRNPWTKGTTKFIIKEVNQ